MIIMTEANLTSGVYVLEIHLSDAIELKVGKLGIFDMLPGYYYYAGTAQSNLLHRINRHLRKEKKLRWHIDYLLEYSQILQVYLWPGEREMECLLGAYLTRFPAMQVPIPGFGASDCKCNSHLYYSMYRPDLNNLLHLVSKEQGIEGRTFLTE